MPFSSKSARRPVMPAMVSLIVEQMSARSRYTKHKPMATSTMGIPNMMYLQCQKRSLGRVARSIDFVIQKDKYLVFSKNVGLPADETFPAFALASALTQDGVEVRQHVRRVPLLEADEFAGDFAVAIDDVGFRVHRCAIRFRDGRMIVFGGGITIGDERYALIAQKFFILGGIFISSNSKYNSIARFDVFLQMIQTGSLLDARRTPRGPEIQHHDLIFQIGEMPRFPGDLQREVQRLLACDRGLALPVRRHRKENHDQPRQPNYCPSHHFPEDSHQTAILTQSSGSRNVPSASNR